MWAKYTFVIVFVFGVWAKYTPVVHGVAWVQAVRQRRAGRWGRGRGEVMHRGIMPACAQRPTV